MTDIICWAVIVYSRMILHFPQKCEIYSSMRENIIPKKKLVGFSGVRKNDASFSYIYSESHYEFNE